MPEKSSKNVTFSERKQINSGGRIKIGVIAGQLDTEYAVELYNGINSAAKDFEADITIFPGMYASSYYSPLQDTRYDYQISTVFDYAAGGTFDAVIITVSSVSQYLNMGVKEFLKTLEPAKVVVLEEEIDGYKCITLNNENGIKQCVEHLIVDHGYKKICFVNGKPGTRDADTRYAAYKETMEAHGLAVTDEMMVYGNFSEDCDPQIEKLLLANPDMEAICFANDYMALAAYRIFERIGYHIGTDIALTGFDNTALSRFLDPPMTTVSANAYSLGYKAVVEAISLVENKPPRADVNTESHLIVRNTCGCNNVRDTIYKNGLSTPVEDSWVATNYVLDNAYLIKVSDEIAYKFEKLFSRISALMTENVSLRQILLMVSEIVNTEYLKISQRENVYVAVQDYFEWLLRGDLEKEIDERIVNTMHHTLASMTSLVLGERFNIERDLKLSTRISSSIINTAILNGGDLSECCNEIMNVLHKLDITGAKLFLYEDTVATETPDEWAKPERLTFIAGYIGKKRLKDEEGLPVNAKDLFEFGYGKDSPRHDQVVFPLVLNNEQYGILVCEFTLKNFFTAHTASNDIASTLKLIKLNRNLMDRSITDELTGLYNRRGFIEKTQWLINSNIGESGIVIFADLDNLKKINDTYGHEEGDFALVSCASILRQSMRFEDIISRHGGDEFVAFTVVTDPEAIKAKLEERFKKNTESFNRLSDKPYYVELSYGFSTFRCSRNIDMNAILKNADDVLYERKKKKRQSPEKKTNNN